MLLEIMNRSRRAAGFELFFFLIYFHVLKILPLTLVTNSTLSVGSECMPLTLRIGFPLSLSLPRFCLKYDTNKPWSWQAGLGGLLDAPFPWITVERKQQNQSLVGCKM